MPPDTDWADLLAKPVWVPDLYRLFNRCHSIGDLLLPAKDLVLLIDELCTVIIFSLPLDMKIISLQSRIFRFKGLEMVGP
ncbi:MAG: hypothetical protein CMH89_01680 [Oceanicaulis sp.]|nr:hypothetical protein [Oceanicaulis sp.]